jgi:ADP-ribose pyrophosphatase YjhB (NUDIX family)
MHCGGSLARGIPANDTRERLFCGGCGFVHYLNPRPVAGVIPVRAGPEILLVRRAIEPRRGKWVFPGGFMDLGETAEQAALRETLEEAHLHVGPLSLVGVYTRVEPGVVLIVYEGEALGEAEAGDETLEVSWFRPDDVPWPHLAFDSTEWAISDWLKRRGLA